MSWFSHKNDKESFAVLVDIGSASVGISITRHLLDADQPEFLWQHREFIPLKTARNAKTAEREINTTIMSAFLHLGSKGLHVLRELHPHARPSVLQVAISAPWSYTTSKAIQYHDENPFRITDSLIDELSESVDTDVLAETAVNAKLPSDDLALIDSTTIGIEANDYPIKAYAGVDARTLTVTHLTALTKVSIMNTLNEVRDKIMPHTPMKVHSFMTIYYDVLRDLAPDTTQACLVDVTYEGTEIAILRDNVLRYTAHIPVGPYTIARKVGPITGLPAREAAAVLSNGKVFVLNDLPKPKLDEIDNVYTSFRKKLTALFMDNGDTLAIPKTIYVHCAAEYEEFFKEQIRVAAHDATIIEHTLVMVTSKLIDQKQKKAKDTNMLLAAAYIQKTLGEPDGKIHGQGV